LLSFRYLNATATVGSGANWYTGQMIDEVEFRKAADAAIEALKQELYAAEDDGEFEVEEQAGALYIVFEEPAGKFVITPNAPVQQIWISALSTSFKLDLTAQGFVLPKTGESLGPLVKRLIQEHVAGPGQPIL
jgi:iron donor protein CyaY